MMYASQLNESEKNVLCGTLRFLMEADGVLAETEWQFFDAFASILGLDSVNFRVTQDKDEILLALSHIKSERSRRICLMELINMAYADGTYCQKEGSAIQEIASCMGIESQVLNDIEQWVSDGIHHARTAQNLFSGEGQ
jgi:uncharacterized tellurite resistance protein B-like protein